MNDYARAVVWAAALLGAAYAAPRLLHLWQQQQLMDFINSKPERESGSFDFEKAIVELEGTMTLPTFDPNWRIATDLQDWLENYLWTVGPDSIVEFGSGASTVMFAKYAKIWANASVVSYEQSMPYLLTTEKELKEPALDKRIETFYAPVSNGWYDEGVVEHTIPDSIDLALIDGPGPCVGRTREPAMKYLYPRLAPDGLIVLDDGRRDMEQLYVEHWMEQYDGLRVQYVAHDHGTFLIRKVNDG